MAVEVEVSIAPGTVLPVSLDGLPPSARRVFEVLREHGPLTHKDLVRVALMPGRTVRYAVHRLREAGIIGEKCNLMDCRQCFFFIHLKCAGGPDEVKKRHLQRLL